MDKRICGAIRFNIDEYEILVVDFEYKAVYVQEGFISWKEAETWFYYNYPTGYIIPAWLTVV